MEDNGIINISNINICKIFWCYKEHNTIPWKYTHRISKWVTESPEYKNIYSLGWHLSGSHYLTAKGKTSKIDDKYLLVLENRSLSDHMDYQRESAELPISYYSLIFTTEEPIDQSLFENNMMFVYPNKNQEKLTAMFSNCYSATQTRFPGWELKVKSILYEALYIFFSSYLATEASNISQDMLTISEYIDNHLYDKKISIKELANSIHISNVHLSRVFSKTFGMPPKKYITERKLESVAYMLTHTDMSINSICEQVGFVDMSYFNKLFKKKYGVTPRNYRKNKEWIF